MCLAGRTPGRFLDVVFICKTKFFFDLVITVVIPLTLIQM